VKAIYADEEAVGDAAWQQLKEAADELGIKAERTPGLSGLIQAHLFPIKQEVDQPSPGAATGAAAGRELKRGLSVRTLDASSEYKLLIVLELADRTLKHTIDHEHIAGKDLFAVRHIAAHLAKGLDNVHAKGGIHADLKPLNVVGDRDTWKIIDFDVFCKVGEPFGNKVPSSGYCPPEMASVLLRAMSDQGKVDGTMLAAYTASLAYDLWSFGAVLFNLCSGRSLWNNDINDNITHQMLRTLATGGNDLRKNLNRSLNEFDESASAELKAASATALLRKLLEPDAQLRLQHFASETLEPMQCVLKDPFFTPKQDVSTAVLKEFEGLKEDLGNMRAAIGRVEKNTLKLIDMSEEHRTELLLTRKVSSLPLQFLSPQAPHKPRYSVYTHRCCSRASSRQLRC